MRHESPADQVDVATAIRAHVARALARAGSPGDVECALAALEELAERLVPHGSPVKVCACVASHTRELVGVQGDGAQGLELNCTGRGGARRSTISVVGPTTGRVEEAAGQASAADEDPRNEASHG